MSTGKLSGLRELFRQRDFSILWACVAISQIGDWMQITAQGWLVVEISGSALDVAIVAACGTLPQMIFVLVGGLVADRYRKKSLMLVLVALQLLFSLVLTLLVLGGLDEVWVLAIFSFALGTVAALWQPIYLSFIPELVPEERLGSAMGLSLTGLYLARTLGPVMAGAAISYLGTRTTFIFNTASFVIPLIGLLSIRSGIRRAAASRDRESRRRVSLNDLRKSARFVAKDGILLPLWCFSFVLSLGLLPVFALLPVYVEDVLSRGARWLGILMGVAGVGQILGALAASAYSPHEDRNYGRFQILGYMAMGIAVGAFAWLGPLLLAGAVASFGMLNFLHGFLSPRVNTVVQLRSSSGMRGRVQGLFLFTFSMVSLGQLALGWWAEGTDLRIVLTAPALIFVIMTLVVLLAGSRLPRLEMHSGKLEVGVG